MADANGDAPPQTNGHASSSPTSQPAPAQALAVPTTSSAPAAAAAPSGPTPTTNPSVPLTSLQDTGTQKRPRDARLIHMLLSSLGVTAYQERVPLQLLDFAYRHTSSILSDALHLSSDAYISQQMRARDPPAAGGAGGGGGGGGGGGFKDADGQVSMSSVQLAIQSRLQYQFSGGNGGGLSKEFLLETAETRNKIRFPRVAMDEWGVRLPNEKFVLTGVPWGLKGEWESEDVPEEEEGGDGDVDMIGGPAAGEEGPEGEGEGEEEGGTAEDLFGDDLGDDIMAMEES